MERHIDERKKLVHLRINVTPGQAFVFGKLTVKGIDIHGESRDQPALGQEAGRAVRRQLPGPLHQPAAEENIFENLGEKTRTVLTLNEKTGTVDVTLDFKGGEPRKKAPGNAFRLAAAPGRFSGRQFDLDPANRRRRGPASGAEFTNSPCCCECAGSSDIIKAYANLTAVIASCSPRIPAPR